MEIHFYNYCNTKFKDWKYFFKPKTHYLEPVSTAKNGRMGKKFFRWMRQISAGILYVWQENSTKYGEKRSVQTVYCGCGYRF